MHQALVRNWSRMVSILGAVTFLTACSTEENSEGTSEESSEPVSLLEVYQQNPAALTRGRLLFEGSCANYCHGTAPQPGEDVDLFDCQWKYGGTNDDIVRIVTTGIPGTRMVGFGNNFPEGQNDLWKLIAFLRSEQQACE